MRIVKMLAISKYVWLFSSLFYLKCQTAPLEGDNDGESTRVINGFEAKQGQFPFMASIHWMSKPTWNTFICSASLVTTRTALTAGHCLKTSTPPNHCIAYGETINPELAPCTNVSAIYVHDNYSLPGLTYDIAVVNTHYDVELDYQNVNVAPLAIGDGKVLVGRYITSIGWGVSEHGSSPKKLRYVDLEVLKPEKCRSPNREICIQSKDKGTCYGDSGGPSIITHDGQMIQVGITSYFYGFESGLPCIGDRSVAMYVGAFADWIKEHAIGQPTFISI